MKASNFISLIILLPSIRLYHLAFGFSLKDDISIDQITDLRPEFHKQIESSGYLLRQPSTSRYLQSSPPRKLQIKLKNSIHSGSKLILTIQDVCSLYRGFECVRVTNSDPNYVQAQISSPIQLEFKNLGTYAQVSYLGFFPGPITIDISYLTQGGFIRQDYPDRNDFSGEPTIITPSSLEIPLKSIGYYSVQYFGYFLGLKDGPVKFYIRHDDGINGQIVNQSFNNTDWDHWNETVLNTFMNKDELYYSKVRLLNHGGDFRMSIRWDYTNKSEPIPNEYLYYPTRIPGSPYNLTSLSEDRYCDDDSGILKCYPCDLFLCDRFEKYKEVVVCTLCKENASLNDGRCSCMEGYYYSEVYNSSCRKCEDSCAECKEVDGNYECITCVENAILESNVCRCNSGYFLIKLDMYSCIPCPKFCSRCFDGGECECKEGFYLSSYNPDICSPCQNLNCKTCREISRAYECTSCIYPYSLNDDIECTCNEDEAYINSNEDCISIELEVILSSSLNELSISFNKYLLHNIEFPDIGHVIRYNEVLDNLNLTFTTIEDRRIYKVLYNSEYDLDNNVTVSLSFSESVLDNNQKTLKPRDYQATLHLYFNHRLSNSSNSSVFSDNTDITSQNITSSSSYMVDRIKESGPSVVGASVSIGVLSSILNMNFAALWSLLNTIEIFSYIPLLNLHIPSSIEVVASEMAFNFIPNPFKSYYQIRSKNIEDRYSSFGFNSSHYIYNNFKMILTLGIMTLIYSISKILKIIIRDEESKIGKYLHKVIGKYEWNGFTRFFIQYYLGIGVTSALALKYAKFSEASSFIIIDFSFAAISFGFISISTLFILRFLTKNHSLLESEGNIKKWGCLYEEVNYSKSKGTACNIILFFTRRLLYSIAISYLDFNPFIQLGFCYIPSLIVIYT
jgi:hypothetical protein